MNSNQPKPFPSPIRRGEQGDALGALKTKSMKYSNSFSHGLRLVLPTGGIRLIGACEFHDDKKVEIEGRTLKRWHTADDWRSGAEPEKTEELPQGTQVHLWDEEAGHPLIGTL